MPQKLELTFSEAPRARWSSYGVRALTIASHFAERSSSQLARSIGLSDDKAQRATEQSSRNIDAVLQSTRAYADAFQSISRELSGFCKERLDRNFEKMSALMRSRTPQELIAAQSDLLRDNMEGFLQTSRAVGSIGRCS